MFFLLKKKYEQKCDLLEENTFEPSRLDKILTTPETMRVVNLVLI